MKLSLKVSVQAEGWRNGGGVCREKGRDFPASLLLCPDTTS